MANRSAPFPTGQTDLRGEMLLIVLRNQKLFFLTQQFIRHVAYSGQQHSNEHRPGKVPPGKVYFKRFLTTIWHVH